MSSFDFYADSVHGNNAFDGLTPATAKRTIAAAQALLSAGKSLGLARGSLWRETFRFQHANLSIGVYGTGAPPIFDCRDIVTDAWTQADPVNRPNVWEVTWTRAQPASTGFAWINLWADNEFVRAATSLADLQANGGAFYASRSATTTVVSIRSSTDPNTSGVVYSISKRGWGINGHSTALGVAAPANQVVQGPIEIVGAIEHYNGVAGGPGQMYDVLIKDGNIHHTVTEGDLCEDVLMSRVIPGALGSLHVAYRVVGTGFTHTARRCLALAEGGASRLNHGGFYAHASTPPTMDSFTVDQCICQASNVGADAAVLNISNHYCVEPPLPAITASPVTNVIRSQVQDLTVISSVSTAAFRSQSAGPTVAISHSAWRTRKGAVVILAGTTGSRTISNCSIAGQDGGITGVSGIPCSLSLSYSVITTRSGRALDLLATPFVGDYNVYQAGTLGLVPVFRIDGVTSSSFANWQTISGGQDLNSVWLKEQDQTAGNPNAFWLGVSSNANAGPADGDWRINPSARAYNAAGAALTGTFADGTTPLTLAGPQSHWNYNTRSVESGPPTQLLILPLTKLQERAYIEDPTAWDFYNLTPVIAVDEIPNEIAFVGQVTPIDGDQSNTSGNVDILLSRDNGATFPITLASSTTFPYAWTPQPNQLSSQAVIRVRDSADHTVTDDSQPFSIVTTEATGGGTNTALWFRLQQLATNDGLELTRP